MPPVTLNQQQFQKLRPNGNYQSYLQFVANRRGVPASSLTPGGGGGSSPKSGAADPANALAALAGYTPLTSAQIEQQAQSEISPIIAAVTGQAKQQAAQQASQIGGLTKDYANELSQMNFGSPYQSGEGQQAAVDAALQQSLTGQGTDLAGGLAERLKALQGSSGAPAVQQAADALSSQGRSIGNTQVASGSAALGNLIANQAAATDFGQKLPAVARLSGLQALGQSAAAQQKAVNDATLQAESQLPSIVQNLTANQQRAVANAVAAEQRQQSLADSNHWKGIAAQQGQERVGISATNAETSATNAGTSQARLGFDAKKFAQQTLRQNRDYQLALTRVGVSKQSLQLRTLQQEYKFQNGGLDQAQVTRYSSVAQGLASQAFASQDKTTKQPVTYQEALPQILQKGVPLSIAEKELTAAGFKPGVRGTPALHAGQPTLADLNYQDPSGTPESLTHPEALQQISAGAQLRNLDPRAVLAVASQEGLGGGIGDNGSSFGPWQLHIGGALPKSVAAKGAQYAQAWAWSPPGINYALDQIAKVAGGLTGDAAIQAIVSHFERPLKPGSEIAGAERGY
jgi:hypothetical protein